MAYNYLNKVGLGNLWGNIKNYITSKLSSYATKAENSLKADDNTVVHLTGDESIDGTKTFTTGVVYTKMPSYAYNDEVTTNAFGGWYIRDKNGSNVASLYMGFRAGDNANDLRLSLKNKSGDTVGLKILEDGSVQSIVSNRNLGASSKPWGDVYATNFIGNATSAATATKATQDGDGKVINTTYAKVDDLALVATSGAYSDLTGKPSIPTVNDAVLTIQQNGENVKTFSANASANVTANITVPTKTSDLTNDSDYATRANVTDSLQEAKNYVGTTTSNMVTTNTYQTITSDKAFSGFLDYLVPLKQSEIPTANTYKHFRYLGNDGLRLFSLQYCSRTNGTRDAILYVYDKDGGSHGLQISTDNYVVPTIANGMTLGTAGTKWLAVYATNVTTDILNIPKNAIVLAFCSSAVNNGSSVAGTSLKVANGGTGGSFTATTETLTGTYRALNTVVANGVGMFVKIA